MKQDGITRGPWIVHYGEAVKIKDANGYTVASLSQIHLHGRRSKNEVEKTARFIVAACNAYEPMREALENARALWGHRCFDTPQLTWLAQVDAALSTLPVNDRHHSGCDNERMFENVRDAWEIVWEREAQIAQLSAALQAYIDNCTNEECEHCIKARAALKGVPQPASSQHNGRLRELLVAAFNSGATWGSETPYKSLEAMDVAAQLSAESILHAPASEAVL